MFIPVTLEDLKSRSWGKLDIIIITGDVYIDSPNDGAAVIGQLLIKHGYRVGIISQPDVNSEVDITRFGEPLLFWGVTAGSVDSMISNYTATKKRRNRDDLTPGGINNKRPDRAVLSYTNLIRKYYKSTVPIVLGGVEASLRRIAHYDYWNNKIRRSILFDSKADLLVYGMGENAVLEIADRIKSGNDLDNIHGTCSISKNIINNYIELPSFEDAASDADKFIHMFKEFYNNNDPVSAKGMVQKHGDRYLVHNPPSSYMTTEEIDEVYSLPFERDIHPFYKKMGEVRALDTIQFSVTTHRGCYGECSFCAIAVHQGRRIISRSEDSIISEIKRITKHPDFKGIISDLGGPTANMFEIDCNLKAEKGGCRNKSCIFPGICNELDVNHNAQLNLLKKINNIKGIKKVFISSGIRYDMVLADKLSGEKYMDELVKNHVSGQLKVAPEHSEENVLKLMNKPDVTSLIHFRNLFSKLNKKHGKKQFLTYYFIAAHPGCYEKEMKSLKNYIKQELKLTPEQVQVFTPSPSTFSTLMYYTGIDPKTGKSIFVERDNRRKDDQKGILTKGSKKFK